MKTLSIDEAVRNLPDWLTQALAGEEIGIRSGDAVVVLRPLGAVKPRECSEPLSPRDALRRLQRDARLSRGEADDYLKEVRAERLAVEDRGVA